MPVGSNSHFFDSYGVRIHYHLYGQRPALIFVHGHPENEMIFSQQINEFARDHTIVLPTLRGYPPSDAVFAATDVGGILGQKLAFLHPERLSGLVIFNTPILGTIMHLIHHDKEQQALTAYSIKYIKHNPGDDYDLDHVVRTIPDPEYRAEIKVYLPQSLERGIFYFFRRNFPGPPYGQDIDTSGMHYSMPCCIIWGCKSCNFSHTMLDGFYKWFDRSVRLVTLPDAGHWLWRDDPAKVKKELRSWLTVLEGGHL
ncbi:Alpha/Beta hydrolase protein [Aspergillus pseudoustus]|uniref:Alpha/Beta hydrolase protein n=1 Tax=Aspergillus pseudoustus TaxID=1810923 RepID=A0ABR4JRQ2_9EURO